MIWIVIPFMSDGVTINTNMIGAFKTRESAEQYGSELFTFYELEPVLVDPF